jgi:hypothetical protein
MITQVFELPYDFFLFFVTGGMAFSMFVHFAVVFVANLRIVEIVSGLFRV